MSRGIGLWARLEDKADMDAPLPIDPILPDLVALLRQNRRAVLQAPPGAGKTTRVPLALLDAGLGNGRIIMLEPRRLAARAAAARMAESLGEPVGKTVGYRIRGESKTSPETRIEVVTEGILTRMIQNDPDMHGVGKIIFDEFHERSLQADLGLALSLDVADLRDDLILVAMSATLDAGPVAEMMKAPVLTSEGRGFPVTPHWLEKPFGPKARFEAAMAELIRQALLDSKGSVLAFLPGEGEIRRVHNLLDDAHTKNVVIQPLYGAMPFGAQKEALEPAGPGNRKVILATAIAETSLTLPDIRVVVDGGRARRAVFDPGSGMSRLVTERVTKAEAQQRAGRAGRVAEGHCYKLWTKGEDGGLSPFPATEIERGDLAGFALELAAWGASESDLRFVTPPHAGRLAEARALLRMLGALDTEDQITAHGQRLVQVPLHPRLAHMLEIGGRDAAPLAALLADRDPLRGADTDFSLRIQFVKSGHSTANPAALARIREEAKRLSRGRTKTGALSVGQMLALAYPDRVGLRRPGDAPRYVLSGGKGAVFSDSDRMGQQRLIVATDLDGDPREARVRMAAALSENELREIFSNQINWLDICEWSRREGRVAARRQERFGALVLDDRVWRDAPDEAIARAMLDGVRQIGLQPSEKAKLFMARCRLLNSLPDMSEAALMKHLDTWLLPHINGLRSAEDWKAFDILPALDAMLDWDQRQSLDREVPAQFTTPLGRKVPIDYGAEEPSIELRLQELFGQTTHPNVAGRPLRISLLSPAGRPVQVTMDLPGFWASSYADVRKDMRGRYPKHPWPEDPTQADPTLRTKRRAVR